MLFDAAPYFAGAGSNHDGALDGGGFVMAKNAACSQRAGAVPITVVLNWVDDLKQRLE